MDSNGKREMLVLKKRKQNVSYCNINKTLKTSETDEFFKDIDERRKINEINTSNAIKMNSKRSTTPVPMSSNVNNIHNKKNFKNLD